MFGSSVLEVAIGLMFVYLLLSLICSAINEGIATIINKRGKNLFEGIKNLLNDPKFTGLAQQLYTHGLVDGISKQPKNSDKASRFPSYIPPTEFALALLDILGSQGAGESWNDIVARLKAQRDAAREEADAAPQNRELQKAFGDSDAALQKAEAMLEKAVAAKRAHDEARQAAEEVKGPKDARQLRIASEKLTSALAIGRVLATEFPDPLGNIVKGIEKLPNGPTKESLLVLVNKTRREAALLSTHANSAERQIVTLQENIERWFNDAMGRVSGWYKRWTQIVVLIITVILVLAANADTLMLARRFTRDNALRASIVAVAERSVQDTAGRPAENETARLNLLNAAERLKLPIGWVPNIDDPYRADQLPENFLGWFSKLVGLLISIFAVSLGAPFWFDTLSKFVNLRGTGTPPGEPRKSAPSQ